MQYLVAGIFKPGAGDQAINFHDEFNDHIGQAAGNIRLFGLLRDKSGKRSGYLAFIDADSFDQTEDFLKQSPFYQNQLYERVEVAEFTPEVGNFEKA
jgi:uncharacterized protein YciI